MRPNGWNPNEMTERESASLRVGLQQEGWLVSHALLVWGKDERGAVRNLIIDGEHRWTEARALGFTDGPMVFHDGMTEAQARELTAKLTLRRGRANDASLAELLRGLPEDMLNATSLGLDDLRLRELTSLDLAPPKFSPTRERVAFADVKPHPKNYKAHPPEQLAHFAALLRDYGPWRDLVLARDNTVLAGHGLLEAMRQAGHVAHYAVRFPLDPLSPAALKIVAADNELGRFADSNDRVMTDLLKDLRESDPLGLLGTGFTEEMLAALAMVTRPASELRDASAAAEWVGMPDFDPHGEAQVKLVVSFVSEVDRDEYVKEHGLRIDKKTGPTWSTRWPFTEREDVAGLRFEPGEGKAKRRGRARRKVTK